MGTGKKEKRAYSTEFKIDAARLVEDQGDTVKETCERLGILLSNLHSSLRYQTPHEVELSQPVQAEEVILLHAAA